MGGSWEIHVLLDTKSAAFPLLAYGERLNKPAVSYFQFWTMDSQAPGKSMAQMKL